MPLESFPKDHPKQAVFSLIPLVFLVITILVMPLVPYAHANGLTLSNVSIASRSAANQTANVQFDITWNNSWRNSINYDAAWVFIKYSTDGGTTWEHATLKATGGTAVSDGGTGGIIDPAGYSLGTGTALQIIVPTEATSGKKGALLQRAANGSGTLTDTGVQLVWDWGTDGLSASTSVRVKVFAIEMVYVPTGSFYLGDGTSTSVTGQFCSANNHTTPFEITSQGALTLGGGGAGSLGNNNAMGMATADDFNDTTPQSLPATFPEGYNAFYMMKYDLSQGQYRDFLNTLTRTQQETRVETGISTTTAGNYFVMTNTPSVEYRNTIAVASLTLPASPAPVTFGCDLNANHTLNEAADGEWIAMNYISWMDAAAYAAWAGLRPFTELEYEKAARGPSSVDTGVPNEYAWGNTTITATAGVSNGGTNAEVSSTSGANCTYNSSFSGLTRVGMYATGSSTRTQAGAGYWGIMDLSGNVYQNPVTVGNATGRAFTGSNGTGVLATDGNATNSDWPGWSSGHGEVSGATGSGLRGGSWSDSSTYVRVSDRFFAAYSNAYRFSNYGARLARTSP